ncbi:HTH-type transcriptional activator CmpR (plasmid) [Nitratireductor thuwali]|uniref:HTH-type transcriptional activator CmpR n=2 Tax=Nitratireductor thuwali TaxID=2267699 RepID=A0ABY5MNX3_9HYPH|nr:HTH-type transcriptional activator CmpR [Nitratireductor thuwali]
MLAGTVTGAGELLRLTQPTVSKLIADLELGTGLTLFERSHGRLLPTTEAQTLLQQIDRVFTAIDDLDRNARQLARGQSGHLRIVAIPALVLDYLPRAVASFMKRRPDITVELNARAASRVVEWIAGRHADLGFASDIAANAGVELQPFQSLAGVCILPLGHPLTEKTAIEPADLAGEHFISLGPDSAFRHHVDRVFEEADIARRIVIETGLSATACAFVKDGMGVSIVDPVTAMDRHQSLDIVVRPFRPRIPFTTYAALPKHGSRPVLVNDFLEHLSGVARLNEVK